MQVEKTKGCGVFHSGKLTILQWPEQWGDTDILKDITYLEIIPIALAIFLWGQEFRNKKILFYSDNEAVVNILQNKTSKSERVMSILRPIVYWALHLNFQINSMHLSSVDNKIADAISRGQVDLFRRLVPEADPLPTTIPVQFWDLLHPRQML